MNITETKHHKRMQLCKTRPVYRQGRKLTAVKAYTINNESQHLFIYGVPQINLRSELKSLCSKYGKIVSIHVVTDCETELFTECYHVQYDRIQSARIAKRLLDDHSFYGSILHVCYAPEYESVEETKQKLMQRFKDILTRLPNQNLPLRFMHFRQKSAQVGFNCWLKPDVYENDPVMSVYRKRKCDVIDSNTISCVIPNQEMTSVINTELHEDKRLQLKVIGKDDSKRTVQHLVPMQVLKHKHIVDISKKKIIFHNKKKLI